MLNILAPLGGKNAPKSRKDTISCVLAESPSGSRSPPKKEPIALAMGSFLCQDAYFDKTYLRSTQKVFEGGKQFSFLSTAVIIFAAR